MMDKFKDAFSFDEVHSILKSSTAPETLVWQNKGSERNIFKLSYFKYFESIQTLELHLRNYDDSLMVDETIYVKLSYRDAVFKGHIVSLEKDILTLYVPTELKAIDLRASKRLEINVKDKKKVSLNIGTFENPHKSNELDFIVTSLSPSGLCIVVSDNNKSLFENNDMYELTRIGDRVILNTPIGLRRCWTQRYRYREGGKLFVAYRSGFEFNSDLDENLINQFINNE